MAGSAAVALLPALGDFPGSGIRPVSPALADGFLTSQPLEKPLHCTFFFLSFFLRTETSKPLFFFSKKVLILYLYIVFYSVQPINNVVIVSGER